MINEVLKETVSPRNMTRVGDFKDLKVNGLFGHYPGDLQKITSIAREKFLDRGHEIEKYIITHVDVNDRTTCSTFFNDSRTNFRAPVYLPE